MTFTKHWGQGSIHIQVVYIYTIFKAETLYNMSFDLNQKKQVFEDNKTPKNRFLATIKKFF